jgi:hypothetical protein
MFWPELVGTDRVLDPGGGTGETRSGDRGLQNSQNVDTLGRTAAFRIAKRTIPSHITH